MGDKKEDALGIEGLKEALGRAHIPPELLTLATAQLERLERAGRGSNYSSEFETVSRYLNLVISLPWDTRTKDNLDLRRAKEVLEKNHYGLPKVKERILEYIAVLNLTAAQKKRSSPVLCLLGLPGIGKTSVAASIAEALDRNFLRLPLGGLGDVSQLRGLPRHLPGSEPGQIIKGLRRKGAKNPVILLDEIDRIAEGGRTAVMGALLEILDSEQNQAFLDHYLDFPFDLSEVLFIGSANNTRGIATAVLDRLEVIEMPSYSDEEKRVIGRDYLLPKVLAAAGLAPEQLRIAEELWPKIIRPLGYDAGIRTLERTIEGIARKAARKVVESGERQGKFYLTGENIKGFLPSW